MPVVFIDTLKLCPGLWAPGSPVLACGLLEALAWPVGSWKPWPGLWAPAFAIFTVFMFATLQFTPHFLSLTQAQPHREPRFHGIAVEWMLLGRILFLGAGHNLPPKGALKI